MPRGKIHHGLEHGRAVANIVMPGIMAFKALQDCETVILAWLVNVYALESPGQGPVFFQMIAELLVGR